MSFSLNVDSSLFFICPCSTTDMIVDCFLGFCFMCMIRPSIPRVAVVEQEKSKKMPKELQEAPREEYKG